jgi:hypothetical protein
VYVPLFLQYRNTSSSLDRRAAQDDVGPPAKPYVLLKSHCLVQPAALPEDGGVCSGMGVEAWMAG